MLTKAFRKTLSTLPRRYFCNYENHSEVPPEELRTKILKTAMIHVNKYGWNDQALSEACIDLGYPPVTSRIVANGPIDLVYFVVDRWNDRLTEDLSYLELEEMRISDRIIQGIKIRLSYQIPYLTRWNEALALGGLPDNAYTTLQKLVRISDDIWFIAGDRSSDYNWYTKRGLLLSAYFTTEMFMLTDKSENYIETWKFLDRRIQDILRYGKYINMARNYTSAINIGLGSLISTLNIHPQNYENDIDDLKFRRSQGYQNPGDYQYNQEYQNTGDNQYNQRYQSGQDPISRDPTDFSNVSYETDPLKKRDSSATAYFDESGAAHLRVKEQEVRHKENIIFPDQDVVKEKTTDFNLTDDKVKTKEKTKTFNK